MQIVSFEITIRVWCMFSSFLGKHKTQSNIIIIKFVFDIGMFRLLQTFGLAALTPYLQLSSLADWGVEKTKTMDPLVRLLVS